MSVWRTIGLFVALPAIVVAFTAIILLLALDRVFLLTDEDDDA